ncbi:MAG TPA: undecaprenyl-diphosphate phosphatase [Candidatus Portnoybacteria bacterium]|nr:undecaprenyl-diphosphate phosphatase [Candidatus Portnoybacteria bacterium]
MDLFHSIILGFVQGITEFLPISSTGHLILVEKVLNLSQTDFLKSFDIIIQLGSILAVVVLYWRELFTNWEVQKRIVVAFIPTGILGLVFYKIVKAYLLGNDTVVLWSLALGGIALILFELRHKEEETDFGELANLPYKNAFIVGIFQSVAMVPGVSRSAATILGGLLMGIKRRTIVEFSFLLAVPTMLAATGLDLIKNAEQFSGAQWDFLAAGFIMSFVVAILSIKFLLSFIKKRSFIPFGVYRIIIAALFFLYIIYK